jgi:hypothetical protein
MSRIKFDRNRKFFSKTGPRTVRYQFLSVMGSIWRRISGHYIGPGPGAIKLGRAHFRDLERKKSHFWSPLRPSHFWCVVKLDFAHWTFSNFQETESEIYNHDNLEGNQQNYGICLHFSAKNATPTLTKWTNQDFSFLLEFICIIEAIKNGFIFYIPL